MNPLLILKVKKIIKGAADCIAACPDWLLFAFALVIAVWGGLSHGHKQGYAEAEALYKGRIAAVNAAHTDAAEQQRLHSQLLLDDLAGELVKVRKEKGEKQTIIKEVPKYVTKYADSQCTIPAGFVWVHDRTLAGENTTVPGSPPRDVDAPTAVTLSGVAEVTASNNAECVERGRILQLWQEWYVKQQAIFANSQRLIQNAVERSR